MPVDSTTFRTDLTPEVPTWPTDLPTADPERLREMQVPGLVIGNRQLLAQFFATQSTRLTRLEQAEKLKSLSAEIPSFEEAGEGIESFAPLRPEEEGLMDEIHRDLGGAVSKGVFLQTASAADLVGRAEQYVRDHPLPADAGGGNADIFDQVFMNEVRERRAAIDERYVEIIKSAKDAQTIVLALAHAATDYFGRRLSRALEAYRAQMDSHDQTVAKLTLEGASTAEIARANADLAKNTSYSGMVSFAIQSIKQKLDQFDNLSQSLLGSIHETEKQIIANMRG